MSAIPSDTRQRVIALLVLLLMIGAGWLVIVLPIANAFAAQDEDIANSHRLLAAYTNKIALRPVIEARLAQIKANQSSTAGLTTGASAELAAANIQNVVKALIESEAGQVHSAQNLAPFSASGFQRIDVQYDVSVPMTRLKEIAYRLETGAPYLFLSNIDMRAPENWDPAIMQSDAPNLQIRWTISGYRWTGGR